MISPQISQLAGTSFAIHHVGIVVPDFDDAETYMDVFQHKEDYRGFVPEFECWCVFCRAPAGTAAVELIIPTGGPLAKFNRGYGGLHHYALQTGDLDAVREDLRSRSIELLHEQHVKGAGSFFCNFISPSYTRGIIVELVQIIVPHEKTHP